MQNSSPDLAAFDFDLDMALSDLCGDGGGSPSSPSAQLVPDSMDGRLSPSNTDDLSQAVLDDLARFDTGYDALGKYVQPTVMVGAAASPPPAPHTPPPQQQMTFGLAAHAYLGGGGARATPSPFSTSSESGSDFAGSSHELPPMIKDEDLQQLSQPPRATMASPNQDDKNALAEFVGSLFPKAALRSSPNEWKMYRSKVKGLTKQEQKMVATLRRKELSCVYAEKARQRRIKTMRTSGEDNQKLRALLEVKNTRIAALEKQLASFKKKAGGGRNRR